jgi:hypothetical protein
VNDLLRIDDAHYSVARDHQAILWLLPLMGLSQGVFALFTMYLPPLFPTLLRTTGAGFCYNIGRIAAAGGTVYFGSLARSGDYRQSLFHAGFLFLPAAAFALFLPELARGEIMEQAPELREVPETP